VKTLEQVSLQALEIASASTFWLPSQSHNISFLAIFIPYSLSAKIVVCEIGLTGL